VFGKNDLHILHFRGLAAHWLHHAVHRVVRWTDKLSLCVQGHEIADAKNSHSRLERYDRRLLGIKMSPANGEWEFEIVAPSEWVEEVKTGFSPTSFEAVTKRALPSWFSPNEEDFEVFKMQHGSFPPTQLYVERSSKHPDEIQCFYPQTLKR